MGLMNSIKTINIKPGEAFKINNDGATIAEIRLERYHKRDIELVISPVETKRRFEPGQYYIKYEKK